jgi:hypothetical protein
VRTALTEQINAVSLASGTTHLMERIVMNKVTADEVLAWIDRHHPDLCDCGWCVTTMNIIAVQRAIIKERL